MSISHFANDNMNDIRIRPRNLLIAVGIWLCITFLLLRSRGTGGSTGDCPSALHLLKNDEPAIGSTIIYAITPTYARPVQKAELTRLAQTIRLQPNVHWIIVEDADATSALVTRLLRRNHLSARSTQLSVKTPADFKLHARDPNWSKPRGVEQRNAGLGWVREQLQLRRIGHDGRVDDRVPDVPHSVVYFMDDDNTYSGELFEQMSEIGRGKVAVWPVGLVGGLLVEKPVLNGGEVIGFNSAWRPERPFPVDMAGFAISTDLLRDYPKAVFSYEVQRGYQESEILRQLVVVRDLQPLANGCTEVLVWHTRTEVPKLDAEQRLAKAKQPASDDGMEF